MTQRDLIREYGHPLQERNNGGIHVALFYRKDEYTNEEDFAILFEDLSDEYFSGSFEIPKAKVLDAWNHPAIFAQAAIHGKPLAKVVA